jgi:cyclopropane fatty-acyl-phospholipid synthase-like methyltransferase
MSVQTVVDCYDLLELSLLCGIEDYTDGIYEGNPARPYEEAQRCQHDYLLDQLGVRPGFRLLDVGCGTGTLLRRAQERGAEAVGITISPRQVEIGEARGLDVRLMSYATVGRSFPREFDGIVANGSIEHFCQPEDAVAGRQDDVYTAMFEAFHRALHPRSPCRRVVTTVIHFQGEPVAPNLLLKPCWMHLCGDRAAFHLSIINHGYGGYYPTRGQLAHAAAPLFTCVLDQEATEDYRLTSEEWLRKVQVALRKSGNFRRQLAAHFFRQPLHTAYFALSFLGPQSWPWQFRGEPPPTALYRQTWQANG